MATTLQRTATTAPTPTPGPTDATWTQLERAILVKGLTIDHPSGSAHPDFPATIYPLDYGHINQTTAGDGQGIDVFIGSDSSLGVTALVVTYDPDKADAEVKVVYGCTPAEVDQIEGFFTPPLSAALTVRRARPAPQVVVFDAMGVLYQAGDDVKEVLTPYLRELDCPLYDDQIAYLYLQASLGRISSSEFWALCGVPGDDVRYAARHRLTPGIGLLLGELKRAGVRLACLSNDVAEWSTLIRQRFRLDYFIDTWVISGEIGHRKPEAEAYAALSRATGIPLERMLLLDDRPGNLTAARTLGLDTIHFQDTNQARGALRDRGLAV